MDLPWPFNRLTATLFSRDGRGGARTALAVAGEWCGLVSASGIRKDQAGGARRCRWMDRDNGTGACRIMTYNIHRCVGTDGKLSPERIADVIAACEADIVALQEVDVGRSRTGNVDQAAAIGKLLDMQAHFHPVLRVLDEQYGDAILTRSPSSLVKAGLLPGPKPSLGRERRGAIWVRAEMAGRQVDIVNTHLGLTRAERMMQVGALIGPEWIGGRPGGGTMILAGDFNVGRRTRSYRRLAACLDPARDKTG